MCVYVYDSRVRVQVPGGVETLFQIAAGRGVKGLPPEDPALDVDAVALLACWGPKF